MIVCEVEKCGNLAVQGYKYCKSCRRNFREAEGHYDNPKQVVREQLDRPIEQRGNAVYIYWTILKSLIREEFIEVSDD